jgi:cyclase
MGQTVSMASRWEYTKGLHDLGHGCHAYLQPDGGWGWSNAGLVVGEGTSLLVDTLFDLQLTAEMLDAMADVTGSAAISTVVNTHANGDHCYGNQLVSGAEIVASSAAAHEMAEVPPAMLHASTRPRASSASCSATSSARSTSTGSS